MPSFTVKHTTIVFYTKKGKREKRGKLAVHPSLLGLSMEPKKVANSSTHSRDDKHLLWNKVKLRIIIGKIG